MILLRTGAALAVATALLATPLVLPDAHAGSRIKAVVNKVPITSNQVNRRVAFLKLRRLKGNLKSQALDELIDEQLKMQEARRLRSIATDAEVDEAFARFAKNNKIPIKIFTKILQKSGATPRGFKEYIRAQISWQRAIMARYGMETRLKSRPKSFTDSLQKTGKGTETTRYTLQQIVFVVPKAKNKGAKSAAMKARLAEAKRFMTVYPGCGDAKRFARGLRDVAVIDKGRFLEPDLPGAWRKSIKATRTGRTTAPLATERGAELIAVCARASASHSGDAKPIEDVFRSQAPELDRKYLADLKKKAKIVRR